MGSKPNFITVFVFSANFFIPTRISWSLTARLLCGHAVVQGVSNLEAENHDTFQRARKIKKGEDQLKEVKSFFLWTLPTTV